ncbi:hypothetical protein LEP3755_48350 [Leptolyngbya sp. NIES-3755]|nr:hypothetical protein LEP3755_48350 [Leptolyngbya sp. NIES-3755]
MVAVPVLMPPRKAKTFKLDEELIEALERLSEGANESIGAYVERVLWRYCQGVGAISPDKEPPKDPRGGRREGAGRKSKSQEDTEE